MKLLVFVLSLVLSLASYGQIKKEAKIEFLADDLMDRQGLIENGERIIKENIMNWVAKNYNGKIEKPKVEVNILNDYHEVGAYQIIFYFTVNTPKQYNDMNFCNSICQLIEPEYKKLKVSIGDCKGKLVSKK